MRCPMKHPVFHGMTPQVLNIPVIYQVSQLHTHSFTLDIDDRACPITVFLYIPGIFEFNSWPPTIFPWFSIIVGWWHIFYPPIHPLYPTEIICFSSLGPHVSWWNPSHLLRFVQACPINWLVCDLVFFLLPSWFVGHFS